MQRKLMQHGPSSLTVSLPRRWVKLNGLIKGDNVDLEELPEGLLIEKKAKRTGKRIELDVSGAGIMIKRMVGAAYKSGYDEVDVRFSSFEEFQTVQKVVREHFIGFTILEQKKDRVLIKNMNTDSFEHFDQSMRRLFHILSIISKETAQAVSKSDRDWLKRICLYKDDADDVTDYCRRAINKEIRVKAGPQYVIIEDLEKVVDTYVSLCKLYIKSPELMKKGSANLLKIVSDFIKHFEETYYSFNFEKMKELGKQKEIFDEKTENIKVDKALMIISRIMGKVFDLNGALMAFKI